MTAVAVVPGDPPFVCSGGASGGIWSRHLTDKSVRRAAEGHLSQVRALAFSPSGQQLVSTSGDGRIKVWDVATGLELRSLDVNADQSNAAVVHENGRLAVVASGSRIYLWDLPTGRREHEVARHDNTVTSLALVGDRLASCSLDTMVRVVDLATGRIDWTFDALAGELHSVALSPDGRQLVVGGVGLAVIKVWDLLTGRMRCRMLGHDQPVECVAVTPDGERVVSGSWDETVRIWDLRSHRRRRMLYTLRGHTGGVNAVTVSRRGRVMSAADDGTLRVWDFQPVHHTRSSPATQDSPLSLCRATRAGWRAVTLRATCGSSTGWGRGSSSLGQ